MRLALAYVALFLAGVGVALLVRLSPATAETAQTTTATTTDTTGQELDRSRRYNRKLERELRRQVSRAERNERRVHRQRRATRYALRADTTGAHWLERAFLCIHHYEGSWSDPGAPYFGGLQMDHSFQRAYGGEFLRAFGTADRWPVSVQMAVGIRGYLARGFHPWPNTARSCGLL